MPSKSAQSVDIVALAHAYRRLVLWVGVQLVVSVVNTLVTPASAESSVGWQLALMVLTLILLLVSVGAIVVNGYKTAEALGSSLPVLWAVAMFFPCINIITLLVLSSRATKACRERGVPVGFLGPDLEAARRQGTGGVADVFGGPPGDEPR